MEHPQGFLSAISMEGNPDRSSEVKAGKEWAILSYGIGIKKYPTCYCTHRAIDCMLDLVNATPIKADEVKKITVNISDYFATVLRNHQPNTGLSAKFSMEFAMASGIIAKRVGLRELTDEFVQRPDVQDLMHRVGRTVAGEPVARATGHATRPLTEAQLYDKFADCLEVGASEIPAGVLFQRLQSLHAIGARELTAMQ